MIERYGLDTFRLACADVMDYSDRMMRREIERLPDGTYTAEGRLDGYPDHPDPSYRDLVVKVAVTIAGSNLTVDLAGTSPQIDLPINMPFVGTVDLAVWVALRSILLDTDTHDAVPTNSGLFRSITITAPEGCLANPTFPAPTIARFCGGNLVADTLMRALAPILPEAISAGTGTLKIVSYSGFKDGEHWVYMDIHEGSYGARHGKDGMDAVDTLYANTRNNPVEDIESHYPLRVTQYGLLARGRGLDLGAPGAVRRRGRRSWSCDPQPRPRQRAGAALEVPVPQGQGWRSHLPDGTERRRLRPGQRSRPAGDCARSRRRSDVVTSRRSAR